MIGGIIEKLAGGCRAVLLRLSTDRVAVPWFEKLLRGALLVPIFGGLWVVLRVRAKVGRPLQVQVTTRAGDRFACRLPDFIQTYLYLFGVWEPDVTAFIRRRLSPGDTFVDVGANIGYHALLAAGILVETGRVVAIEASPVICRQLQANLDENNATVVRTVNKAAAQTAGTVRTYQGPEHNIGLSTTVGARGFTPETEVEAAPLADLLEPDEVAATRLVKIDVEGAEDDVLRGMETFLAACPDNVEIVLELSPLWWADRRQTPRQVLQPMIDAGFNVYEINNNLWPWRYLWPNDIRPPRRLGRSLDKRVKRLDLVLSRTDSEVL